MKFRAIPPDEACAQVVAVLRKAVNEHAHALWLVSGGSCIEPEVNILKQLTDDEIAAMTVMLADERYGPAGHADSNFTKLMAAGFVRPGLRFENLLKRGMPFAQTTAQYNTTLKNAFAESDTIIATLGIGEDGHTAGILPRSAAAADNNSAVVGYRAADFDRLTAGFSTLRHIDEAFVFAYGEAKRPPLLALQAQAAGTEDFPSMVLHDLHQVTIYNDSIGGEST